MYDMLKARPEVTEIAAVPDGYVPVIKMHFSGIPVRDGYAYNGRWANRDAVDWFHLRTIGDCSSTWRFRTSRQQHSQKLRRTMRT